MTQLKKNANASADAVSEIRCYL